MVFGEARDEKGISMFISVNINPKAKGGAMLDFHPIASACGKSSDAVVFICRSDVLYLDKEKRTKAWLASVRLQLSAVDESTFDSSIRVEFCQDRGQAIQRNLWSQFANGAALASEQ